MILKLTDEHGQTVTSWNIEDYPELFLKIADEFTDSMRVMEKIYEVLGEE